MREASALRILTVTLIVFSAPLMSLPSLFGIRGFYRTVSAYTPSAGSYSFFMSALYQQALVKDSLRFIDEPAGVDTMICVEDREHYLDGMAEFGLAITDDIELALTMSYLVNAYQFDQVFIRRDYVGIMDIIWGPGDVRASVKYGREVNHWITAGGLLWLGFPLSSASPDTTGDADGYWNAGDLRIQVRRPFLSTGKGSWGFLALVSSEYGMFEGNVNLGYSHYRQEYADSILGVMNRSDGALDFGVGLGLNTPQATLFVEYSIKSFTSRKGDTGYSAPSRFSGGIRIFDESGAYLDVVGELGLTDYDREESDPHSTGNLPVPEGIPGDWGVMMALGFDTHFSKFTGDDDTGIGSVVGTVVDAETGQPLSALVSFPGNPISPTISDSITGFFSAPVTTGTLIVRVEADGYVPSSATLIISEGQAVARDFQLSSSSSEGSVSGTVTDRSTGLPVAASVLVEGISISTASSASGTFSLDLPGGAWSLRASADGFLDGVETVSVTEGQTTTVDFSLNTGLESGGVLSFSNIYFESGSANIQPSSYSVLDEVVELLSFNSEVSVQIVGYTDSDGSSSFNQGLSERRAQSVMNYLTQSGIAGYRLSTMGMGESQPVASNSTPQGKAQNRRIEFRIL